MLSKRTLELWKNEGLKPANRVTIFPDEWTELCTLALKGLALEDQEANATQPEGGTISVPVRLVELIRQARAEGWYEDNPQWTEVERLLPKESEGKEK